MMDNRSAHNFIYSNITKKEWIEVENHKSIEVKIAHNTRIQSQWSYSEFKFEIQATQFQVQALVIQLGRCDMVLGF